MNFSVSPKGPFDLLHQNQFFGGWTTLGEDNESIAITFPVEGWKSSATVVIRQNDEKTIIGKVYGTEKYTEKAWEQAIAILSLDIDGTDWPKVGERDEIIGNLQQKYQFVRPLLFHSPYEAAAAFIIGHRISILQRQSIMEKMAHEMGDKIVVEDKTFYAFPHPEIIEQLSEYRGISAEKIERLHGIAQAAIDGILDREYLRSLPVDEALAKLRELRGVGDFFAQGILHRGAGLVDEITNDELTKKVIKAAYKLDASPPQEKVREVAENWHPYRMWTTVLLHIWMRREMSSLMKDEFSRKK